jgi:hypothetical protein
VAISVQELLDMLYEMIDEAKSPAFSSDKCVIERDRALDLIDEMRAQIPVELAEAKKLIAAREEYVAAAKAEGDQIRSEAEEKARKLVAEDQLLLQAKSRGEELIRQAEERSRELRRSANDYCEDALRRTQEAVAEAHEEISTARARFRNVSGGAPASAAEGAQKSKYDIDI